MSDEDDDDRDGGASDEFELEAPEDLEGELRRRVLASPPRCLDGVAKSPAAAEALGNEQLTVAFELSEQGGGGTRVARVLAYDLKRFMPEYDGPSHWISPVSLHWDGQADPVVVFDSKLHGYHGELDAAAHRRGDGTPDVFRCACGGERFRVAADFGYWGATFDLLEDAYYDGEPDQRVQDYFGAVRFRCRCETCGATSSLWQDDL